MKRHVWLVYRPAHGYEESIENYFACATKAAAQAAADRMNAFLERLAKRLPDIDDGDADWTEEWQARYDRREAMLNKARWPFGVDLRNDLDLGAHVVQVMEILVRRTV